MATGAAFSFRLVHKAFAILLMCGEISTLDQGAVKLGCVAGCTAFALLSEHLSLAFLRGRRLHARSEPTIVFASELATAKRATALVLFRCSIVTPKWGGGAGWKDAPATWWCAEEHGFEVRMGVHERWRARVRKVYEGGRRMRMRPR